MHLQKLILWNYKNYQNSEVLFSPEINVFTGPNGSGKTNLLDAVHYLSLTKSAFAGSDSSNIRKGESFFRIEGFFEKEGKDILVETAFSVATKKILKADKHPYEKAKDHIGKFPVILITPYDTDIVREGGEERRKFFDAFFSQLDPVYLSELIRYNHILKQRNSLLKQFFEQNRTDQVLISAYDSQLLESGKKIFEFRQRLIEEMLPSFHQHFQRLTGKREEVQLIYESRAGHPRFEDDFRSALRLDIAMQRTTKGIHRDDYLFQIHGSPLKSFGSQGQQKSYVIALKLAHFDLIKNVKGLKPILLLDDIFDKLDDERISRLMEMVAEENFGQLFITDARAERTLDYFKDLKAKISIFKIENGSVKEQIR